MKQFTIECPVTVAKYEELTDDRRELVSAARAMTANAYAPYSHFHVGAAIRLADGTIVTGSNQENAAYPSGTCAERTACYYASATHPATAMKAIAIAAVAGDGLAPERPTAPCAACRQALLEYEKIAGAPIEVVLAGREEIYIIPSVNALVPLAFTDF